MIYEAVETDFSSKKIDFRPKIDKIGRKMCTLDENGGVYEKF